MSRTVGKLAAAIRELLAYHAELIPTLPPGKQRAAEAQTRTSMRRLFGVESAAALPESPAIQEQSAVEMAVEIWRFLRAHERAIFAILPERRESDAEARAESAFYAILSPLLKILAGEGIRLVAYEGVGYEPNYPVEAVNADEMGDSDNLVMSETLEPVLVRDGKVLRYGKVFLAQRS